MYPYQDDELKAYLEKQFLINSATNLPIQYPCQEQKVDLLVYSRPKYAHLREEYLMVQSVGYIPYQSFA